MSEIGLDLSGSESPPARGHRKAPKKKRGGTSCLVAVVVLAIVAVGAFVGITKGVSKVSDLFGGPRDYSGQGSGTVQVEVKKGDTVAAIGRALKAQGVVASVDAFIAAAGSDEKAQSLQPGFYRLSKKMSAQSALDRLTDKTSRVEGRVTVPEGSRVGVIVKTIVENTDITQKAVVTALDKPRSFGLPAAAKGNPEGYLYPATYSVPPGTTATQLLGQMVDKTVTVAKQLDVDRRGQALGLSSEEVLTVASIIEYEAKRDKDLPKVARVIYNRLKDGMPLQLDSTVSYASKRKGDVWTTSDERNSDSKYNTYKYTGLPPGPIGSPGQKTIEAALKPASGPWLYFVPINFATGETLFTDSYSQHLKNVEKSKAYCRKSDIC